MSQPDFVLRRRIAEELLGMPIDDRGFAQCPGHSMHSGKTGTRDFQILFDGAPTARCFHASCMALVDDFNHELRRRIWRAENPLSGNQDDRAKTGYGSTERPKPARTPEAEKPKPRTLDRERAVKYAQRCEFTPTDEWLLENSPVQIPNHNGGVDSGPFFLDHLYQPGERILIFTNERSQGQFIYEVGRGGFRLGKSPGVTAKPSTLPLAGKNGVWFLVQPVSGQWLPNVNNKDQKGNVRYGRRHGDCVTAWRYLVLESDELPPDIWLRILVQLPLSVVAIYTSGGRSHHALVRIDAPTKEQFDLWRDKARLTLAPLGADPAAITAVRLSRFPGCIRYGKTDRENQYWPYNNGRGTVQRLLYLAPNAPVKPILDVVNFSITTHR